MLYIFLTWWSTVSHLGGRRWTFIRLALNRHLYSLSLGCTISKLHLSSVMLFGIHGWLCNSLTVQCSATQAPLWQKIQAFKQGRCHISTHLHVRLYEMFEPVNQGLTMMHVGNNHLYKMYKSRNKKRAFMLWVGELCISIKINKHKWEH